MPLESAPLPDLTTLVGFGVAGNFAGHLEQAGEAADFVRVAADLPGGAPGVAEPPKGIFPWYIPGAGREGGEDAAREGSVDALAAAQLHAVPSFLATFPISHDEILLPEGPAPATG